MTNEETLQLDPQQLIRLKAVELAIQEINVYSKNGVLNSNTTKLLNSAHAIAEFIETGIRPGVH